MNANDARAGAGLAEVRSNGAHDSSASDAPGRGRAVAFDGNFHVEQHALAAERLAERRTADDRQDLRRGCSDPQRHAALASTLLRLAERLERRVLDIEHAAEIEHDDPGLGF